MQKIRQETKDKLENIKNFKKEMYKIQCRNWIPSKSKGSGAAGITLEKLLGKETDRYVLPDYGQIEIKVKNIKSNYPIGLFSCAFDNKPHEMQRLLKIGGYPDKKHPQFKVFQLEASGNRNKLNGKYAYKVHVNYDKKKVEFKIRDKYEYQEITTMSWSFYELKLRLETKLSLLAIVPVKSDKIDEIWYFKYRTPDIYELKSFETFLKLLEEGIIKVQFKISFDHSEEKFGEYLDRGTTFRINHEDIEKLFNKIEI